MIDLTDETFKSELKGKTPLLVDFFASWCGPCHMLDPVLKDLDAEDTFKGKLRFSRIDTEEYPKLAEEHNVQGIPCLIIFKDGEEKSRIVGFAAKAVMKAKISNALDSMR